jgi:hypothetical protein
MVVWHTIIFFGRRRHCHEELTSSDGVIGMCLGCFEFVVILFMSDVKQYNNTSAL